MRLVYSKRLWDFEDAVRPNGGFSETAPYNGITVLCPDQSDSGLGDDAGPIGWGTVVPHLLRNLWRATLNKLLLRQYFPSLQRWIALLLRVAAKNDGVVPCGLGDWSSIDPMDVPFTSTCFLIHNLDAAVEIAEALEESSLALLWKGESTTLRQFAIQTFSGPCNGTKNAVQSSSVGACGSFASGTQADQAFAFHYGLVNTTPDPRSLGAAAALRSALNRSNYHFQTGGIWGTPYLLQALMSLKEPETALRMMLQTSYPSFGYMFVEKNATSLWEVWEWSNSTYSHNHAMFGGSVEWLLQLAGLGHPSAEEVAAAVTNFTYYRKLRPLMLWQPTSLLSVNASVMTWTGVLSVAWQWKKPSSSRTQVGEHNKKQNLVTVNKTSTTWSYVLTVTVPAGLWVDVEVNGNKAKLGPGKHEMVF